MVEQRWRWDGIVFHIWTEWDNTVVGCFRSVIEIIRFVYHGVHCPCFFSVYSRGIGAKLLIFLDFLYKFCDLFWLSFLMRLLKKEELILQNNFDFFIDLWRLFVLTWAQRVDVKIHLKVPFSFGHQSSTNALLFYHLVTERPDLTLNSELAKF